MDARQPVIVGIGDLPIEKGKVAGGLTNLQMTAKVAKAACDDAGIKLSEIDGLLTAGLWGVPGYGHLVTLAVGEYLGMTPTYMDGTNIGGSAFEAHVAHASMAIRSGYCETALIVYASNQRSERSRTLGGRPADGILQWQTPWGLPTPVGGYALAAMRHMHEYGTTSEQLAEIAVATRKWAALNPAATNRDPLTIDGVLSSEMISDPLHLLDCCLVTDGAGALIMTTAERARDLNKPAIVVRGYGEAQTHQTIASMPDFARLTSAELSGKKAMQMAGVTHGEIDVTEIYDSFTITVLLSLEALGFCGRGEGGAFVANQRTAPGGDFPLNTNGGGLSCIHPGMYGMFLLIEATRQLRGEAGDRQVKEAETALVHGTGGMLSSGSTIILSRG